MRNRRVILELLLCCFVSSGLIHWIPVGYRIKQTYELSGNVGVATDTPAHLASGIRTAMGKQETSATEEVRCSAGTSANRFECSAIAPTRSAARELSATLKDTIPSKVGWIRADVLKSRVEQTQGTLRVWNQQLASLVEEFASLEFKAAEAEKQLTVARAKKAPLENDLSNRKKQLEILEEAVPDPSAAETRTRFESKKKEVTQIVQQLQARIDAMDAEAVSLSAPLNRRAKITEALPKLRAQIDLAHTQIDSWSPLLSGAKSGVLVADPNGFQVAALEVVKPVVPLRSWKHLPWSLPLGFFLFSILRRKDLADWRKRFFQTPEEVVKETGLPYLGGI